MPKEAHKKAANCFKEASKQHEDAAKHIEAGNHKDAACSTMQANANSCQGKQHAQEANAEYTKKQAAK